MPEFFKIRDSELFRMRRKALAELCNLSESDVVRVAVSEAYRRRTAETLDPVSRLTPMFVEMSSHTVPIAEATVRVKVLTPGVKCDYCKERIEVGGYYILKNKTVGGLEVQRWCGCGGVKLDRGTAGDFDVVPGHVHKAEGGGGTE